MAKKKNSIDKLTDIRWKTIYLNEEETSYQISDNGLVFSKKSNKLLSPSINSSGYPQVGLRTPKNEYSIAIHRLVAKAFIENPDPVNKLEVNHIDGNKLNNHYTNLEWVTHKENIQHACETGLRDSFKGVNSPKNKYSEATIRNICQLLEDGYSQKYISDLLGVNKGVVNSIKQKKMWKHISCEYNIPTPISRTPRDPNLRERVKEILNSGEYDTKKILKMLDLPSTRLNRTYVAVVRYEFNKARSSSTIDQLGHTRNTMPISQ